MTMKRKTRPINWDNLELQAYNLRYEPIAPEEKLKKAQKLAAIFRKNRQPLPNQLAILV